MSIRYLISDKLLYLGQLAQAHLFEAGTTIPNPFGRIGVSRESLDRQLTHYKTFLSADSMDPKKALTEVDAAVKEEIHKRADHLADAMAKVERYGWKFPQFDSAKVKSIFRRPHKDDVYELLRTLVPYLRDKLGAMHMIEGPLSTIHSLMTVVYEVLLTLLNMLDRTEFKDDPELKQIIMTSYQPEQIHNEAVGTKIVLQLLAPAVMSHGNEKIRPDWVMVLASMDPEYAASLDARTPGRDEALKRSKERKH